METTISKQPFRRGVDYPLIASMLLAAFLNMYLIWTDKYVNTYYTTAVASMMKNMHNFFYGTLDSGGFVTVDKPPLTFMLQTIFAFIFGLHGWSVILPQALAGVGSVLLIYLLVKPAFGAGAARVGALVMACTPVAVSVSRTNNIDSMLVFVLLLAVWFLFKGVKQGKMWAVIVGFAWIGIGFNVKMLEAYMVLPAFYFFYLIAGQGGWRKKTATLVASTLVCAIISLSWAVIVDSKPVDQRPYIGSSQTNSVLNLAFGYNGVSRLTGDRNPGGSGMENRGGMGAGFAYRNGGGFNGQGGQESGQGFPGGPGAGRMEGAANGTTGESGSRAWGRSGANSDPNAGGRDDGRPDGERFLGGTNGGMMGNPGFHGEQPPMGFGGGGGMFNTGTKGPLRLFQSELSGQASWMLPFVLFGCITLFAGFRIRRLSWKQKEALFWLAWLIPVMGFFSMAGFFHQYYLIMLAPPVAALTGAGWTEMTQAWRDREGWMAWLLPASVLLTAAFSWYIVHPYDSVIGKGWSISILITGILAVLWLTAGIFKPSIAKTAAVAGFLMLLIGPMYWAFTPIIYGQSSMTPAAGPSAISGFGGNRGGGPAAIGGPGEGSSLNEGLYQYLKDHNTGETYLFAATDYSTLAPYIIEKGETVISLGGFSGSDPVLSVERLQELINSGQLKYIYLSGGRGGNSTLSQWIQEHGTEVPSSEWQQQEADHTDSFNGRGFGGEGTLYAFTPE